MAITSKNKDNQKIEVGQLIEFEMRNIFLEKSCTKCGGGTILRHIFKKIKIEYISRLIIQKFYTVCFRNFTVDHFTSQKAF